MFKLDQCAEKRWRRIRGFPNLAQVITNVCTSKYAQILPERAGTVGIKKSSL